MKKIIDFFLEYYAVIIDAVVCFVAFLYGCVAERKSKKSRGVVEILSQLPEMVSQVESVFPVGNGNVKLGFVLRWIEKLCDSKKLPFDKAYFTELIENILAAPTSNKTYKGGEEHAQEEDRQC